MSLPVAAHLLPLLQLTSQPLHMACSSDITSPAPDDPWTATSLLSALLELVLAFLFLAGATISFFTAKFVRFFGLQPPCFDQGGNWRERRSNLQRYLFCDRLSKELCTLSHGFIHRSYIENTNVCEACSPSYRQENSCSEFDSLSSVELVRPNRLSFACNRHLPQKAIHDMRTACSRPQYSNGMMIRRCDDDIVALQNQIWRKTDACPLHGQCGCRLAIRRRSQPRFAKRKFDSVFLEGLSDDDDIARTEVGCSQGERVRSLKVFPEEMMTNRAPSEEEICETSSMDGKEGMLPNHCNGVRIVLESPGDHTEPLAGESVEILEESIQHSPDVPEEVSRKSDAASGEGAQLSGVVSELPSEPRVYIDEGECAVLPLHPSGLRETEDQADSKREDSEENATDCHTAHRQEHLLVENNTLIESPEMVSNGGPSVSESESAIDAIKLKEALEEEREVLDSIYLELEKERISSATAADEAMAMISRLQKDKAALQLESVQYQRIAEEKSMYDQQAIAVLRDILLKREAEKLALEKEIELYRRRLLKDRIEARERERATEEAIDVLVLEGNEELVPLVEGSEVRLVPATGGASADDFCEMDIPYERASFLFNGPRNLIDSFESVSGDYSSAGDKMAGQVEQARNGGSVSHHIDGDCSPTAVGDALNDKLKADASDRYVVNSRNAERDKDDQTENSLAAGQVQSAAPYVAVRPNENRREKKMVRKSRGNAEEQWQHVVERVWNLEEQICQLKAKHNLELQKPLAAVQRHANSKDRSPQKLLKDRKKTSEHKKLNYESSAFKQGGLCKKPGVRDQAGNKLPKSKLRAKGEGGHSLKIWKTGKKHNQSKVDDTPGISSLNCGDKIEHNCNGLTRDPLVDECVRVNEVWSGRGDDQLGEPDSFLEETELPLTGAETPEEQSNSLSATATSPSSCSTSESESSSSGAGRTDDDAHEESQTSSPRASSFDFRTTSMVMRDKSKMAVEKEVQNLMSRLQALEADRELMRQSIESMRKERSEMELLQEVAQQLRELQVTEGRLMAREVPQQCDEVSSIPSIEDEKSLSKKRRCLRETLEIGQHVPPSGDTTQIVSGDIGC